jgi:hypothetical protein
MRIARNQIRLSEDHPSLFLELEPQKADFSAPLIMNREGFLIDGYRRFQLLVEEELEVAQIDTNLIYPPAFSLNQRTRNWDETDCFLWFRWAKHLGVVTTGLPFVHFPDVLFDADRSILKLIAQRKLLLRQAQILLGAPQKYRPILIYMLSEDVQLNVNETRDLVEMLTDLANQNKPRDIREVTKHPALSAVLADKSLNLKQKGERLLREVRVLRYPYIQRKLGEFSENWRDLQLEPDIQTKKNLFVERGVLELNLSARSFEEMRKKVERLCRSLTSELWNKIWEKE